MNIAKSALYIAEELMINWQDALKLSIYLICEITLNSYLFEFQATTASHN